MSPLGGDPCTLLDSRRRPARAWAVYIVPLSVYAAADHPLAQDDITSLPVATSVDVLYDIPHWLPMVLKPGRECPVDDPDCPRLESRQRQRLDRILDLIVNADEVVIR